MKSGCNRFIKYTGMNIPENLTISSSLTEHKGSITAICISVKGLIVVASHDKYISIWCPVTYNCLKKLKFKDQVTSLCALSKNRIVCATKHIYILDLDLLDLGKPLCIEKLMQDHNDPITNITNVKDVVLYVITSNKFFNIDLKSYEIMYLIQEYKFLCKLKIGFVSVSKSPIKTLTIHRREMVFINFENPIWSICKFRKGFSYGCENGSITVYDDSDTHPCRIMNAHASRVTCLIEFLSTAFGSLLVSGSFDLSIKIWQIESNDYKCVRTINVHSSYVRSIAIHPNKNSIVSTGDDNTICITSLEESMHLKEDDIPKKNKRRSLYR